jgi:hypothetical protein
LPAFSADITEKNVLDAVLGRGAFSPEQQRQLDLNRDQKLDAADIVYFHRKLVMANFVAVKSTTNESISTRNVTIQFSRTLVGTLGYTVGGTATPDEDYVSLSGSVAVNGTSALIPVQLNSDTVYEGTETIRLSLLPSPDYIVGPRDTHTIELKDNPLETSADYLFILSRETLGVSGSTTQQMGFPPTLFSRTASVTMSFSSDNILHAALNPAKSIGILDPTAGSDPIDARSVSYSSGTLEVVFEFPSKSESFVSDPSITTFNPENPSLGSQTPLDLTNTLTLSIVNFDITADKFADKHLQGTFSLRISGVLREGTTAFFQGTLSATLQP